MRHLVNTKRNSTCVRSEISSSNKTCTFRDDDSSMYEVFNRLNTGGVNLRPQEIRTSMYHSNFYEMLYRINTEEKWRRILQSTEPDLHMKDIEILLRGFAMLINGENYAPSMIKFLNQFSKNCERYSVGQNEYFENLFASFLNACADLPDNAFMNKKNNRFNIALYEAVFSAVNQKAFSDNRCINGKLDTEKIRTLETDPEFSGAALAGTTQTANVKKRLNRALEIVGTL